MRRRIRFCCAALGCALFLCPGLVFIFTMPSIVSSSGLGGGVLAVPLEFATLHAESAAYWIRINIPAFRLTLFQGEAPVKIYPIAVGKPASPSRIGTCQVVGKAIAPTWYPPGGGPPVPPGPDNPISCRWLGLSWAGYGIHGTNNPASIGKAATLGCIRMHDEDVMELFSIVPVGAKVEFVYDTVEVDSDGEELMNVKLTVYQDLYQQGTNTVERVMESLRDCLAKLIPDMTPGMTPDVTPDVTPDAMPSVNLEVLSELVKAAKGKPEQVPWQVRVEIAVPGEFLHSSGGSQEMPDSGDMMAYPWDVASDARGVAFACHAYLGEDAAHSIIPGDMYDEDNGVCVPVSEEYAAAGARCASADHACNASGNSRTAVGEASAAVSDACATVENAGGGAYAGASFVYALTSDTCGEACTACAPASAACTQASDAWPVTDYEKARDARILPGTSHSAGDGVDAGTNTIADENRVGTDRIEPWDSVRVETDLAHIEGDRVLVALRPVAEAFGYRVGWDAQSQAAVVDEKVARGVVRAGRFYVTPDELQRLLEDVLIAWDPKTLTLRIGLSLSAER